MPAEKKNNRAYMKEKATKLSKNIFVLSYEVDINSISFPTACTNLAVMNIRHRASYLCTKCTTIYKSSSHTYSWDDLSTQVK